MSGSVAGMLYEASQFVPAFHLEDVYVTGMLRSKYNELAKAKTVADTKQVVRLEVKGSLGFSATKRQTSHMCLFARTITSHHHSTNEIKSIYEAVQQVGNIGKCKQVKKKSQRTYAIN